MYGYNGSIEEAERVKNYRITEKNGQAILGSGSYGTVYHGFEVSTGRKVAIKKIKATTEEEGVAPRILREIALLKSLKHERIVSMYNAFRVGDRLFLIFELVETDLSAILFGKEQCVLDRDVIEKITFQLLTGLDFCHKRGIIHRDLKPHNILLDSEYNVKIADFGIARAIIPPIKSMTVEVATLFYRAPELLLGASRYSTAIDIWSIGIIILDMALNRHIFQGDSQIHVLIKIFSELGTPTEDEWPGVTVLPYWNNEFPDFPSKSLSRLVQYFRKPFIELLEQLLQLDPRNRLFASEALDQKYYYKTFSADIEAVPAVCTPPSKSPTAISNFMTADKKIGNELDLQCASAVPIKVATTKKNLLDHFPKSLEGKEATSMVKSIGSKRTASSQISLRAKQKKV